MPAYIHSDRTSSAPGDRLAVIRDVGVSCHSCTHTECRMRRLRRQRIGLETNMRYVEEYESYHALPWNAARRIVFSRSRGQALRSRNLRSCRTLQHRVAGKAYGNTIEGQRSPQDIGKRARNRCRKNACNGEAGSVLL